MAEQLSTDELYARFSQLDQQERQQGYGPYPAHTSNAYSSSPQVPQQHDYGPRRLPIKPDPYSSSTFPSSSSYNQQSSPQHPPYSSSAYNISYDQKPDPPKLKDDPNFGRHDEFGFDANSEWMEDVNLDQFLANGPPGLRRDEKPDMDSKFDLPQAPKIEDDGERAITAEEIARREQVRQALEEKRQRDTGQPPDRPRSVNGIEPLPITVLNSPDYEAVFQKKFKWFNPVQSAVYPVVFESDENLVVSAPTGSGKTTIFDLAILRMIEMSGETSGTYAIYLAPTKALCGERTRDWRARLEHLNVKCSEVTGDTTSAWAIDRAVRDSRLIITTPEKWEAVTRNSSAHTGRGAPALVMIDEVHFLRDNRGATLEVVISRMKSHDPATRFVALSATVPNIKDIARWLIPVNDDEDEGIQSEDLYTGGDTKRPDSCRKDGQATGQDLPEAKVFQFGEDFRPVKLLKHVVGYPGGGNDFALIKKLEASLWNILVKYSESKPVLVFCSTRRACQSVAEFTATCYVNAKEKGSRRLPWDHEPPNPRDPHARIRISDQKLRSLATYGIAFHHAGLDVADRREVEERFLDGRIKMIACTSTLAVGVNLPAHTVVILGTSAWQGPVAGFKEYSDIDIQQMMGRAGRPQFDQTGTCIVMCDKTKEKNYRDLVDSKTTVESALHSNLTDHINTEIGLKTITSLESAKKWLRNSFLFIRIQQNPRHYMSALGRKTHPSWQATLDHHVEEAVSKLERRELIEWRVPDEDDESAYEASIDSISPTHPRQLFHTEYGKIMSAYVLCFDTMSHIMSMESTTTVRGLLELLAGAAEFQDLRIRPGEVRTLNQLRKHPDIRYPLDEPPQCYADKVFLHLQAGFGNVTIDDEKRSSDVTSMIGTQIAIFKDAVRITKAIAHIARFREWGRTSKNAIELLHTVYGKAWEDTEVVFRQIPSIGPKSIGKLGQNQIASFDDLRKAPTHRIETLLGRTKAPMNTPNGSSKGFGEALIDCIDSFPRYSVTLQQESLDKQPGRYPIATVRIVVKAKTEWKSKQAHDISNQSEHNGPSTAGQQSTTAKKTRRPNYNLTILAMRTDGFLFDFRRMNAYALTEKLSSMTVECELRDPQHKIEVYAGVDELAGCATQAKLDLHLKEYMFEDIADESIKSEGLSDNNSIDEEVDEIEERKSASLPLQKEPKVESAARHNTSRHRSPSPRPSEDERGGFATKRSLSVKDEYREAIANVSKPRTSSQRVPETKPRFADADIPVVKHKHRPSSRVSDEAAPSHQKTRRKRARVPTNVSRFFDTEAVESDDDGSEAYDTDGDDFIDDMHEKRIDHRPLKKISNRHGAIKHEIHDYPEAHVAVKRRLENHAKAPPIGPSTAKAERATSSDDFDGIEDVEVVLDNIDAPRHDPEPLFLSDLDNDSTSQFSYAATATQQALSGNGINRPEQDEVQDIDVDEPVSSLIGHQAQPQDEDDGASDNGEPVRYYTGWQGPELSTQGGTQNEGDHQDDVESPIEPDRRPHAVDVRAQNHQCQNPRSLFRLEHYDSDKDSDSDRDLTYLVTVLDRQGENPFASASRQRRGVPAGYECDTHPQPGHSYYDATTDRQGLQRSTGNVRSDFQVDNKTLVTIGLPLTAHRRHDSTQDVDPRSQGRYHAYEEDEKQASIKREPSVYPPPIAQPARASYEDRRPAAPFVVKREMSVSPPADTRARYRPQRRYGDERPTERQSYVKREPSFTPPPMNRPDRSQSAHDDAELDHTYRPLSGKRHVLQDEPANYRYHQEETVQEMPLYDPEEEYQSDYYMYMQDDEAELRRQAEQEYAEQCAEQQERNDDAAMDHYEDLAYETLCDGRDDDYYYSGCEGK